MPTTETIARWLAFRAALDAGQPEPWTWAVENVSAFMDEAALPWTEKEYDEEMAEQEREDEAVEQLANMLIGPAPSADAPAAEQQAYAEAVMDLFPSREPGE